MLFTWLFKKNRRLKKIKLKTNQNSHNLYKKFLLIFLLKGNIINLRTKFNLFLIPLLNKLKKSNIKNLITFFLRLQTYVEVRNVHRRRQLTQIPFYISFTRQLFFILVSFKKIINSKKSYQSFNTIIINEYSKVIKKKKAETLLYMLKNNILAYKCRSNSKFRWY